MCPSSGIYRDRVKSQLNILCVGVVVLYTGIYLPDIPVYTVYTVQYPYTIYCCTYCTYQLLGLQNSPSHTVRMSCTTRTYYSTTHIIYSSEPRHGFSFRMATTHTGLSVGGSSSVFCSIFLRWSIGDHKRRCCNSHKCRRSNVRFEDPLCDFSVQTA